MKQINDILKEFAEVNQKEYVSYNYEFFQLVADDEQEIVKEWRERFGLNDNDDVELIVLSKWREELLNEYPEYWFGKIPEHFNQNVFDSKQFIMDWLWMVFEEEPQKVFLLNINTHRYYACSSEEYIFLTRKGTFALSLQVHD